MQWWASQTSTASSVGSRSSSSMCTKMSRPAPRIGAGGAQPDPNRDAEDLQQGGDGFNRVGVSGWIGHLSRRRNCPLVRALTGWRRSTPSWTHRRARSPVSAGRWRSAVMSAASRQSGRWCGIGVTVSVNGCSARGGDSEPHVGSVQRDVDACCCACWLCGHIRTCGMSAGCVRQSWRSLWRSHRSWSSICEPLSAS